MNERFRALTEEELESVSGGAKKNYVYPDFRSILDEIKAVMPNDK